MINFIPVFPLDIVVYPGEALNLHIFEDRYKELVKECMADSKPFGIPSVQNQAVTEMGTLVEIREVVREYEDGCMDIRTTGTRVFRILEILKTVPDKKYQAAIVSYPENDTRKNSLFMQAIFSRVLELHRLLQVTRDFKRPPEELLSYDLAHHAGLSPEEEYELLELLTENQRLEYLRRHLKKIIPLVAGTENLKEKIKLNGHFKELKGFDFDL